MARKKLIVAVVTVALGVVAIALVARPWRRSPAWAPPKEAVRFAKDTSDHLTGMPTVPAGDTAALKEFLGAAPALLDAQLAPQRPSDAPLLTDGARDALHQTLADIVALRAQADAEAYASYMRGRGAALRPLEDAKGLPKFQQGMFAIHAGREQTPDDTPWTVFRDAFEGDLLHERAGSTRPTGLAVGENSAKILFGVMETPGNISHAFLQILNDLLVSTPLPEDAARLEWSAEWAPLIWFIGQEHQGRSYWRPSVTLGEVIARDGHALVAEAHLALVTKGGHALPTRIFLYHDPQATRWHIDAMSYVNTYAVTLGAGPAF